MRLCPEFPGWPQEAGLQDDLGGCLPGICERTGGEEGRGDMRRPERRTQGDRHKEPGRQPPQRRIHRRGARQVHHLARIGLRGHLEDDASGGGEIFLVVVPVPCPREQRRLAYRLLPGLRKPARQGRRDGHPQRNIRLRPLPGGTRIEPLRFEDFVVYLQTA